MRQQIQMRKLIKNSAVYLCGKSETNCISKGLHYDETGEKTIYCGHKLSAHNKHWHSSFVLNFILWKQSLYTSCSSNLITSYSFNGQIIHFLMLVQVYLKNRPLPNSKLSPDTHQLEITCCLTSIGQHIR